MIEKERLCKMRRISIFVFGAALVFAASHTATAVDNGYGSDSRYGHWTMQSINGEPRTVLISTASEGRIPGCLGRNCGLILNIKCNSWSDGRPLHYTLAFYAPCPSCIDGHGHPWSSLDGPIIVTVSIDAAVKQFDLRGYSDASGFIETPLTAEHVLALSQSHRSILVSAEGRLPVIYAEPDKTAETFTMLSTACQPHVRPK